MNKELLQKLEKYNWLKPPYEEFPLVTIQEFFSGNNDPYSFAANACIDDTSKDCFYSIFKLLEQKKEVDKIWISLYSYEIEESDWPYADTAYISTNLPKDELNGIFGELQPSEISEIQKHEIFGELKSEFKIICLWWD